MAQKTEIAGVVGTWVAAGIAIIALLGIVGPLLVWRASRTERNRAIDVLNEEGAESGGFVSDGIPLSPSIRLFRRFQAPDLRSPPSLPTASIAWNDKASTVSQESAGWVQFGKLLEAYQIGISKSNVVTIQDKTTWLPVHRSWILVVGIVGRYARRMDNGKLQTKQITPLASVQARPGAFVTQARLGAGRNHLSRRFRNYDDRLDWAHTGPSHTDSDYKTLHGITGTLHLRQSSATSPGVQTVPERLFFKAHRGGEIGALPAEPVQIDKMFWLAVGCLPSSGLKIFSLDDVLSVMAPYTAALPPPQRPLLPRKGHTKNTFKNVVDESDSYYKNDWTYKASPSYNPNTYVIPAHAPAAFQEHGFRLFRLSIVNERVEALAEVAKSFNVEDQSRKIYSLEEMNVTSDVAKDFELTLGATYVPLEVPWVRFGPALAGVDSFLRREDAQALAHALLWLPMSPHGYLVSANKNSNCRRLLSAATQSLPQLLVRMMLHIDLFKFRQEQTETLVRTMNGMYNSTQRLERTRLFFQVIYDLDIAIADVVHPNDMATTAVGILMITNEEFRALIAQSARHVEDALDRIIDLDLGTSTLNIPAVMGFVQKFPVELRSLFPGEPESNAVIKITFQQVMFAALKASVRSAFLDTSLDSWPLFKAFFEMESVTSMG